MALAVPLALKKLLGIQSSPVATTDGIPASGETWGANDLGLPPNMPKNFGITDDWSGGEPRGTYGPIDLDPKKTTVYSADAAPASKTSLAKAATPAPSPAPLSLKKAAGGEDEAPAMAAPNNPSDIVGLSSSKPTADQLPSLAPQGSSHAVPAALLRLMGITAEQPKPGELYTGPVGADAKLKAGVGFVGRLGNALAAAAGTPEQQQLAEKRSEFGPELAANIGLKKATLASLDRYRQGELSNVSDRNDINQQKADQANQVAVGKMRARGYVPDEETPGTFRAMNADEILADPRLSKDMDMKTAAIAVKSAQQQLAQAHTDAIMNPNNPTYQQKEREIQSRYKLAQAHLSVAQGNLAVRAKEGMWQFGENPLTGEQLGTGNAPPGMLTTPEGAPVPYKQNASYTPPMTMKTMQGMAKTLPVHIQELRDLIDEADQKGYIGPVAGRVYQEYLAGKVGSTGDPDADALLGHLKAADTLMASAMMRTHYGGRGAQQAYENFRNLLPNGGSRELLEGSLDEFSKYIKGYSTAATPDVTKPRGAAPTAPPTKANENVVEYVRGADGKLHPKDQ